jgi:hypothetical protein
MNESLIQYNDDGTVNVPFGQIAEWYISKHPLLKSTKNFTIPKYWPELLHSFDLI